MRQGVQVFIPHIKETGLFFSLAVEPSFWPPGFHLSLSLPQSPSVGDGELLMAGAGEGRERAVRQREGHSRQFG